MVGKKFAVLGVFICVVSGCSLGDGFFKSHGTTEGDGEYHLPELIQRGNYDRNYERVTSELFDDILQKLMNVARMSSLSVGIIKNDDVVWTKGYGLYDRERDKVASEETIYLVASISKTVTATALMQLHERGYFSLDDDVNEYLPFNVRNPTHPDTPITIRMLLAHQSSLAAEREDLTTFFTRIIPGNVDIGGYPYPFLKEYLTPGGIHYKPGVWTESAPGEEMHYANIGYALLGYLVEILSGEPFEDYCREHIFDPLEMKNTRFKLAHLNISRVAVPYDVHAGEYYPIIHYDTLDCPAGGLRASVMDLSRFLIAHMNGGLYDGIRIITEDTVKEMHSVQYESTNYLFKYGLGCQIWHVGTETHIGHTGGLFGVSTKMVFRQSDKTGIIFFTNKQVNNLREMAVFALIERLLFWKGTHDSDELRMELFEETFFTNAQLYKGSAFEKREEIKPYLTELYTTVFS